MSPPNSALKAARNKWRQMATTDAKGNPYEKCDPQTQVRVHKRNGTEFCRSRPKKRVGKTVKELRQELKGTAGIWKMTKSQLLALASGA